MKNEKETKRREGKNREMRVVEADTNRKVRLSSARKQVTKTETERHRELKNKSVTTLELKGNV